ncbi:YbhB/YbcL family Raf kinase inhibitor-like protein [Pantoea sp.]|uniref:YbhB/YbcL family Raf kinase inhibitor-like protein n=1 Tax=Pantoea sp. TaxID=69393 RepID=UPI00289765BE|nr:YbhB/YbcL family Raf kinase inhibitor-like protein [Pantoea sp.]
MAKLRCTLLLALLPATAMAAPVFTLESPDFADNGVLAAKFAGNAKQNPGCTGENISPALRWSHAPAGTKSFALLIVDPVGGKGLGVTHMVAYNISAEKTAYAQGELSESKNYTGGKNTPGTDSYFGPCPPAGSGLHHYNFVLIATDLAPTALTPGLSHAELLDKLKGHNLGAASTVARYGNE